jgi:hypothetical protein
LKRILLAFAVLAVLIPIAAAQAEPVQEFSFQLKDVKPDGRFTVVFTSRTYDTTGGIPPVLRQNFLRLPTGAKLRKEFLNKKYYCDGAKLLKDLQAHPDTSKKFYTRVENLGAIISTLKKDKTSAGRASLKNAQVCDNAEVGRGTVQVDARPFVNELIPAKIYLFFGKGTQPGAKAAFSIIGVPDENAEIVRSIPVVRDTRVAVTANFFSEPTEGKYDYKLVLPTGAINGINISIAEVNVTTKGLTLTKKKSTCAKKRKGKCVKKKVKKSKVFWFTQPTCPASGKLSFLSFYGYDDPVPDITKTIELPCPNFKR